MGTDPDLISLLLNRLHWVVFDIEATNLSSDEGRIICCGFKPLGKKPYMIGLKDVGCDSDPILIDRKLAVAIRDELEKYDGCIGWNCLKYDLPFIGDRLLIAGERRRKPVFVVDAMYYFKMFQSCLKSARLDWVSRVMNVASRKTPLEIDTWKRAEAEMFNGMKGDTPSYDRIVYHCKKDLEVTEQVFHKAKERIRSLQRR